MINLPRTSVQLSNMSIIVSFQTAQHKQRKKGQLTHRAWHRMARRGTNRDGLRVAELQHACQHCTDRHEVDQARLDIVMKNHAELSIQISNVDLPWKSRDSRNQHQVRLHISSPLRIRCGPQAMHVRESDRARRRRSSSKTPRLERAPVLWHVEH
jgi:hypothetical protein